LNVFCRTLSTYPQKLIVDDEESSFLDRWECSPWSMRNWKIQNRSREAKMQLAKRHTMTSTPTTKQWRGVATAAACHCYDHNF
jgi:hypothetical protein